MNEHDLRDAFRTAVTTAPPSMNGVAVLDAARRADRKRKATFAGLGAAGAVVAITAGAVLLPGLGGTDTNTVAIGAPSRTTTTSPPTESSRPTVRPDGTTPSPRDGRAEELLDLLAESMPPGFVGRKKLHRAKLFQQQGDLESWRYTATVVTGTTTALDIVVHTAGNGLSEKPCAEGDQSALVCEPLTVDGKRVWISTYSQHVSEPVPRLTASHRHADGTIVSISQSGDGEPPFTKQTLAELVVSPKFVLR